MSATVSATGRQRRPAACARVGARPATRSASGSHSGSSIQGSTLERLSASSGIQRSSASPGGAEQLAHRRLPDRAGAVERAGDALLGEVEQEVREIAGVDQLHREVRAARARARRRPAAIRRTHHGSRKTLSCGPTISPARTVARGGSTLARSAAALSGP